MKNVRPEFLLLLLLVVAAAASGWLYGIHWKKVATGEKFTPGENQLFLLQDQIEALSKENARLIKIIKNQKTAGKTLE